MNPFLLLMWKNWKLQSRKPVLTVFEIGFPVFFGVILLLIRQLVDSQRFDQPREWAPFTIDKLPDLSPIKAIAERFGFSVDLKVQLAYTPDKPVIKRVMETVSNKLNISIDGTSFNNEAEMLNYLKMDNASDVLAGIVFQTATDDNTLPKDLSYTLRFPSKLRTSSEEWFTEIMFPAFSLPGPREAGDSTGGIPNYFEEGFLAIQHAVNLAVIKELNPSSESEVNDMKIQMRRFPYPPYVEDDFIVVLQRQLPFLILLSFIVTAPNIVKDIIIEKENRLKEFMKMMGLTSSLHWLAWFLKYLIFLLIAVILLTICFKIDAGNGAIINASHGSVIFVFLLLYSIATIMFCFAVSTCFSKSNSGSAAGGILFFINYMPYFFLVNTYSTMSMGSKIQSCLLHNVAMAFGCQLIAGYEGQGSGIQWSNLSKPLNVDDDFSMGIVFFMLIFDSLLYWFIMFYVDNVWPGEYGIPQRWYFLFTKTYWCGASKIHDTDVELDAAPTGEFLEEPPSNIKPGIRIRNLKKVFTRGKEKKVAVAGTYLDMYEGQITALLGHNGAGKTTTMSMLTGFIPPTSGTATINGYDIRKEMKQVRESLGMCPQHDVLFDTLTVEEHLYYYGQLKGIPSSEIHAEIDQMLIVLHLEAKRKAYAKSLSGGMKRKLSVGIALMGASKIVILDEPTSGMDPEARRQMWDILQSQRQGRTIILSTHFMDEADLLGDRIAIMAEGVVQCCGSSLFLKGKYGVGYHMIMVKESHCDVLNMTSTIQKFVADAQLESNISAELSYLLPKESSNKFEELFTYLEENMSSLGITSFGASVTTMEEVFLRVGESANEDIAEKLQANGEQVNGLSNPAFVSENGKNGSLDQTSLHVSAENARGNIFGGSLQKNTGLHLTAQQFYGMFVKRIIHTRRNWLLSLSQLIVPMFFTLMACLIERTIPEAQDSPSLKLVMSAFSTGQIAVFSEDTTNYTGKTKNIAAEYEQFLNGKANVRNVTNVNDDIIRAAQDSLDSYNREYMVAASFQGTDPATNNQSLIATALFNNQPYHAISISLSLMGNALLNLFTDNSYTITAYNHPQPRTDNDRIQDELETAAATASTITIMLLFGMSFLVATFIVFLIKERQTNSKHIQFVSGVHAFNYWFSTFVWDFLNFLIPTIVIIIILAGFNIKSFTAESNLLLVFLVFILYAWCVLPSTYILSWMFTQPAGGYAWSVCIFFTLGLGTFLAVIILQIPGLGTETVGEALQWVFYAIIPHFCFGYGLFLVSTNYQSKSTCGAFPEADLQRLCLATKLRNETNPCCPDNCKPDYCATYHDNYLEWKSPGIGAPVFFMVMQGFVFFLLLFFFESGLPARLWQKILESTNDEEEEVEELRVRASSEIVLPDSDVMAERDRISTTDKQQLLKENSLVLKNLQKYYGNFLAVDGLSVGIPQGECFGLLGVNGAGKTTTFKMMTGDHPISAGEAYLDSYSVIKEIKKVQQRLGYCPQFDALIEQMTVMETLTMYARLRGIQESQIKTVINSLMEGLLLSEFTNKLAGNLSGGNKRKLSTAIALIGDPPIIFLDEPTTGMDPMARRLLWDTLTKVRQAGKTLVLTSHSMEECEALCTRIAIMVNGQFKCLGATQHLKSKFGEGYTLIAKVKQDSETDDKTLRLMNFAEKTFSHALIKDKHQGLVHYQINDAELTWAKVFGIMERAKVELDIEDYSVSQTTLEQVFISFARKQKPPKESNMGVFRKCGNCCKFFCCCKCFSSSDPRENRHSGSTNL